MTTDTRLDGQLTDILEELYLGRAPEYEHEAVATAVQHRQRAAWTFPVRWLPVLDIAGPRVRVPRVSWQAIGVAILLVALLLAAALVAGSRQTNVPAPFGVARNGLVAYAIYGDIGVTDIDRGTSTLVVSGPEIDSRPVFSRDGTRLAFLRATGTTTPYELMVANADGTGVRPVRGSPFPDMDGQHEFDFEWTGDSRSLIVYLEPQIIRVDASGSADPVVLTDDAVPTGRLGPNGRIPYQPRSIPDVAMWTIGVDGGAPTELFRRAAGEPGGMWDVRYSPDGTMLAFVSDADWRIYVVNADGTGLRRLTNAAGLGEETRFTWSPDSRFIAFNQWTPIDPDHPEGDWQPHPIGIAQVPAGDGGSPVVDTGPSLGAQGADFDWSPDGRSLIAIPTRPDIASRLNEPILIDVATGEPTTLHVTVNERTNWQRLAPLAP
jgi:dipeptidyl aminopeptidase/acylaminoacyl peptidase